MRTSVVVFFPGKTARLQFLKKEIPFKYTIGLEQVNLHIKYVAAVWPIFFFKALLSQILDFADKAILTDPPQHGEKINMKRIQRVYRKNAFIYTLSTAIKRPKTSLDFVMSLHSLWHDLRLEMSLNSHFNHIHVITLQKKQDIYISLTHKQFRGFKSVTRRFFFGFFSTSKSHGNITILFKK